MSVFRPFEAEVVRTLVGDRLPAAVVEAVLTAEEASCEYSGSGYLLTVRHPLLPADRVVCTEPAVVGTSGEVVAGFLVILEDRELTLECHSWGGVDVPEDFREHRVELAGADGASVG